MTGPPRHGHNAASALVPGSKGDVATARSAVDAGWPAVQPVLRELVDWCLDGNWPVARVLAPFLGSLGAAVADSVGEVLRGDDPPAKYFLVTGVVAGMPRAGVAALASDLRRLADEPTPGEVVEELPRLAREQLDRLAASD